MSQSVAWKCHLTIVNRHSKFENTQWSIELGNEKPLFFETRKYQQLYISSNFGLKLNIFFSKYLASSLYTVFSGQLDFLIAEGSQSKWLKRDLQKRHELLKSSLRQSDTISLFLQSTQRGNHKGHPGSNEMVRLDLMREL